MAHHAPAPLCIECGSPGKLVEDDDGYVVICTNRFCEGVPSLCKTKSVDTKDAAWNQWRWEMTGVCR
jgi:hypothetical protein